VPCVEHPVSHAIPEFDQRTEERRHVSPSMTGEKARNVLEEDDGRPVSPHKLEEGEGEAGAGALDHAPSLACDGEVLAWEAAGPEGGVLPVRTRGCNFG
jgi:hypothetical protein